jgi:ABC-type branched-subunit amino acid transport system substrate-binding protein
MNNIVKKIILTTQKLWLGDKIVGQTKRSRREFLKQGRSLSLLLPVSLSPLALQVTNLHAQPTTHRSAPQRPIALAQIVDMSTTQQDVSKDFLIGSRAAWQEINARGGVNGHKVTHWTLETDGSPQSLQAAWSQVRDNPSCVMLFGSTADPLANQLNQILRNEKLAMAHVAPWLQSSSPENYTYTFPIFANRGEQIAHALKSLSVAGLRSIGVVFASETERTQSLRDVQNIAKVLNLDLQEQVATSNLREAGQKLSASSATVILFVGGTPELAQFSQGLEKLNQQRYIVALADVNLQTLQQMGSAKTIPIIVTQAVPVVSSALPIAREYRQALAKLFDEPPTPLSLAGYIAARYTYHVLLNINGPLSRTSVLDAFNKRQTTDIGGFRVVFDSNKRNSAYVTQSMLSANGRVIG